jgi:ankyrin repeat protein
MKAPDIRKASNAAAAGDCVALRKLLAATPELAGEPAVLNAAALFGRAESVKLLLAAGANPDGQVPSHEYYRPLHRAIEHRGVTKNIGHREVVELLLEADASLDLRATWMQLVPLAVAGMAGDAEMIGLLTEAGAGVNIFTAAAIADAGEVRRFLRKKSAAVSKDSNNMTVLHYAALSGMAGADAEKNQRAIAEMLLDAGADGDSRELIGPYPATPVLHFAAWKNYAAAEVLLSRGCNANFGFGNCLWRQPGRMAELFVTHGADVNGREPSGQPLLNSRVHWNLTSVVLWLLEKGADPNLTDKEGNAALHEAAMRGVGPKVVQALLDAGAKRSAKNAKGLTACDLAIAKKREKIVPLLKF